MKSWPAHHNINSSIPPLETRWVLVIFTDEGPIALASEAIPSLDVDLKVWVLEWGELVESVPINPFHTGISPVGDLTLACKHDLLNFSKKHLIHNRLATLFQVTGPAFSLPQGWGGPWGAEWGYLGLSDDGSTVGILYQGIIRNICGTPERSYLTLEDLTLQWNLPVPATSVDSTTHPYAPTSSLGQAFPRLYGKFLQANQGTLRPLKIRETPQTRLASLVDEIGRAHV